ncbi:MAG TPA: aminotransferase class III-fold pyridoxal phosphate-dependent enzyme, partial [Methylomirabilota bacterium]|nr:aminotransferase class III-fold pyridoxal phosphate-dependent enzyme [Methylomirabilota bacterium]
MEPDGSWPIAWAAARGVHVRDEDGRRYLDLTAAFGVAAAGHANPRVVAAGRRQMG